MHLLLSVVQRESEVLPPLKVNRDRPDLLARSVEDLEVLLLAGRVADQSSSLELDLVGCEIGSFVPDVQVLVREIEGTCRVLLDGEMEGLDALAALVHWCIACEHQSGAAEPKLLFEDALI